MNPKTGFNKLHTTPVLMVVVLGVCISVADDVVRLDALADVTGKAQPTIVERENDWVTNVNSCESFNREEKKVVVVDPARPTLIDS